MQTGRWNETATQIIQTRITVNGVARRGKASIDAQCYEGHPSKAATSPAATCSLELEPPWSTSNVGPNPIIAAFFSNVSWPPLAGQPVTVDVGDGVRWWRCFTGRVDSTQAALSDGKVQIECVDESVRLDLRSPLKALSSGVVHTSDGIAAWAPIDMQGQSLVDHAARAAGFHTHLQPAWDAKMFMPMVGTAHPVLGEIIRADHGLYSDGRVSWTTHSGDWQVGNKVLNVRFSPSTTPVEVTMDIPPRTEGQGWTVLTLRGVNNSAGIKRGPFIAYDHDQDVIRYGIRTSLWTEAVRVPTSSVATQGTPIPRGSATRVALRFNPRSPTASQHHFDVRTDSGASVDVRLTDSSGDIQAFWTSDTADYFGAGTMGAVQIVGAPATSFAQLYQTPSARIRHDQPGWLDASRDLDDLQARTVLERLAAAECGTFWVDRNAHLQYAGPRVRETQDVAATLTTDLDITDWAWTYNFEQRAKKVRIDWTAPATSPSNPNTLLWTNQSGAESLGPGEMWEQIVTAEDDEDWLYVDTTSEKMHSGQGRNTLIRSSTHGGTLTDSTGGELWDNLNAAWTIQSLGNRSVKWTAKASTSMPSTMAVDLRIPTNATNLPQWWGGRALPRLLGSRIKWVEKSTSTPTQSTIGSEEYVHDASWYVHYGERLDDLRDYLSSSLSSPFPVFDEVPVRADPRYDVGDRIYLHDKQHSFIRYDAVILKIAGDWEDGAASMRLKVRVIGFQVTDSVALADALLRNEPHWLQDQPSWKRAT